MATISSDYLTGARQTVDSNRTTFDRKKWEEIAHVFDISIAKITGLSDEKLQNKCFKKVVRICENENWEKINSVRELIIGIIDSRGRSVYEVLTSGEDALPNFCTDLPENLVFQGGGPKGIAYIGVVEVLEERKIIPAVKRVAGTSAGAITATLIAMGYSSKEVNKLLTGKALTDFLDISPSCRGGICRGIEFLNWINELIEQKTGIPNCTFGELRREIKKGRNFKHLHVFAIKAGVNKEPFQFSSEDKKWDPLVIADAVRASMSLPVIFPPHSLHFKNAITKLREPCENYGSFMDGGLSGILFNLPIEAFDKKRYITHFLSEMDGNLQVTNKRTLAFSLYTPGMELPQPDTQVTSILKAYGEWGASKKDAVKIYQKAKTYDAQRTVKISNCHVKTLDFGLSQQKMYELINSGRASTQAFFLDQEERLSRLMTLDPVDFQKHTKKVIYLIYKNNQSEQYIIGVQTLENIISFHTDYTCSLALLLSPFRDQFSFTRLAEHDDRFTVFVHLLNKDIEKADEVFLKHQSFFKKCFYWEVFRKLIIERNCPEYLQFFMAKGFSFNSATSHPVWHAYRSEAFKSFKILLQDPAIDLRVTEHKTNKTLLYYLAKAGQLDLAEVFCKAFQARHPEAYQDLLDQKVNSSVGVEKTAFIISLEKQKIEVAKFLIEEGVDYLKEGHALLHSQYTCCSSNEKARYFLWDVLSGKIDRDLSSQEKIEALHFCLTYSDNGGDTEHDHFVSEGEYGGSKESSILKYKQSDGYKYAEQLIRNKIICTPIEDVRTSNGNGFILTTLESTRCITVAEERLIRLLLEGKYKDNVNQTNKRGITPLIYVTKYNFSEGDHENSNILDCLLATEGLDVNYQDNQGNTALHYAVSMKRRRHIEALLAHQNINPNIKNKLGRTPLHLENDSQLIELFMQKGADNTMKDHSGITPQELRQSLIKPTFISTTAYVVGGAYKELHESNMPLGMKILGGTMITLFQPLLLPMFAAADAYSGIKHAITEDGSSCTCFSCERQRNANSLH